MLDGNKLFEKPAGQDKIKGLETKRNQITHKVVDFCAVASIIYN
jgi:hypothetical protein